MGNKNKRLGKSFVRKRRKAPNDGCFGRKKPKTENDLCQTSTSAIPIQETEMITEEQGCKDNETQSATTANLKDEMIIQQQGYKANETASATTTNCEEEFVEKLIILPENEQPASDEMISGRRILDMAYLFKKLKSVADHNSLFNCGNQCLSLVGEKRVGLLSKFKFKCDMCSATFYIDSEDPVRTENVDINIGAVIGIVSAGIGYSQFEEVATSMNISIFGKIFFSKLQSDVFKEWEATAVESMEAANQRERLAAISEGRVDKNGIALIDVYADGCWSTRSYGNNYRALSGAAAIIGRRFGEVLFMAVKNKYCLICARAKNKNTVAKDHVCYKNYDGSSTGMEAEIICEGFKHSIEMHNVIYQRLIADGDSATYAKILATKPYPGTTVTKIECRNHILRNLCNKLRTLAKDVKYSITHRKLLTDKTILTIRKAIVCSIKENKKSVQEAQHLLKESIENLYADIQNSALHAFGDHRNCKNYYCNKEKSLTCSMEITNSTLWFRLKAIISTVAAKSQSLYEDVDTNTAERFNSVIAKMVGGKRINFSIRNSYQGRCSAAVVSFNTRLPKYAIQKKWLGQSPRSTLKKMEIKREKKRDLNRKHPYKKNRMLSKVKIQNDYGENCAAPDISEKCLEKAKQEFLQNLKILTRDRNQIQKDTILQRDCSDWLELRRNMLTASNFGKIIKKKDKTSCKNIVKSLLYKENLSHVASVAHGIENEKLALEQLARQENILIDPCGLFVDSKYPFIGATPDGIVGDDTIVEVKCPIIAYKKGLEAAIAENKIQIYRYDKKSKSYSINTNSNWYYQVQGQLHVTDRAKCLFAIWTGENKSVKIEYIKRDDEFWNSKMEPKLVAFYMNCVLPEIVNPRYPRGMPIRDPNEKGKENCEPNSCPATYSLKNCTANSLSVTFSTEKSMPIQDLNKKECPVINSVEIYKQDKILNLRLQTNEETSNMKFQKKLHVRKLDFNEF